MDVARAKELLAGERSRIEAALAVLEGEGPLEGSDRREPGDEDSEDATGFDELRVYKWSRRRHCAPACGEEEVADDRGHEIRRQMNAGPGIAPVARVRRYTPQSKSRCFTPVIATTGRTDCAGMHQTGEQEGSANHQSDTCIVLATALGQSVSQQL